MPLINRDEFSPETQPDNCDIHFSLLHDDCSKNSKAASPQTTSVMAAIEQTAPTRVN
jgi:hypothetical protein